MSTPARPLPVLFAGTPPVAVEALEHLLGREDIQVVGVLTRPDAPVGRKRVLTPSPVAQRAAQEGITVIKAARVDAPVIEEIRATGASIAAVIAYGCLLRAPALAALEHGWINLHFSRLPQWRGAAPVQRALISGQRTLAATTFRLDEGMDTGPVIEVIETEVDDDDTADSLLMRLARQGAPVLARSLLQVASGATGTAQEELPGEPSHAAKLEAADARVDFTAGSQQVAALVRGVTSEPGAWTMDGDARLKITDAVQPVQPEQELAPGRVRVIDGRVCVGTGDGAIALRAVQPAGKKAMDAAQWARGRGIEKQEVTLG